MTATQLFTYDTITLNNIETGSEVYINIIQELYHRMNIDVEFLVTPLERSLHLSNTGITDGELLRAKDILETNKNLRMVPTPLITMKIYVYTIDENIRINSIDDLSKYTIAILRGTKFTENMTKNMNVRTSNTLLGLFKILVNGRVDLVVNANIISDEEIKGLGFDNIIKTEPPLTEIILYHMLHKKHENLIPEFDRVINEMIEDGTLQKIKDSFKN